MKAIALLAFLLGLLGAMLIILIGVSVVIDEPEAHQPVDPVSDSVTPPRVEYITLDPVIITITPEPEIVTVYEPVRLKDFETITELKHFITWTWATSPAYLELKATLDYSTPGNCELWAVGCQQFAQEQGYRINFQVTGFHAECSAIIGNEIWMFDPKSGDSRVGGYLD